MLFTLNQSALSSVAASAKVGPDQIKNLHIRVDVSNGIIWNFIARQAPSYFSHQLLDDIRFVQNAIDATDEIPGVSLVPEKVRYLVFGSENPDVFSLGGDLQLFRNLILERDRAGLTSYAIKATDAVFHHSTNPRNILSFSLVRGVAMGGGFEAALAANVLVAERGSRLGFPEVLFGLFPGMGAYTFLKRRVGEKPARSIIESAKNYSAEELFDLGIVDVLADRGEGEKAIYSYIARHANRPGVLAFRRAVEISEKANIDELYSIAEMWVETALHLPAEHIRRIDRLVASQKKNYGASEEFREIYRPKASRLVAIA